MFHGCAPTYGSCFNCMDSHLSSARFNESITFAVRDNCSSIVNKSGLKSSKSHSDCATACLADHFVRNAGLACVSQVSQSLCNSNDSTSR